MNSLCAICQSPIDAEQPRDTCGACGAEYHQDCWVENGGCAVYGCAQAPAVEPRKALEIPVSYWGQENKPCPACGQGILAAAIRCRFCGATFGSARPEDALQFRERTALQQRLPQIQKRAVLVFVLCVIPCLAPVGAFYGGVWYARNRQDINALPALYPALCKLGLAAALLQTAAIIVLTLLYSVFRSS